MAVMSTYQGFRSPVRTVSKAANTIVPVNVSMSDQAYVTSVFGQASGDAFEFRYYDGATPRQLFKLTTTAANQMVDLPHPIPSTLVDFNTGITEALWVSIGLVGGTGLGLILGVTKG